MNQCVPCFPLFFLFPNTSILQWHHVPPRRWDQKVHVAMFRKISWRRQLHFFSRHWYTEHADDSQKKIAET
jgi:hypothetical protein